MFFKCLNIGIIDIKKYNVNLAICWLGTPTCTSNYRGIIPFIRIYQITPVAVTIINPLVMSVIIKNTPFRVSSLFFRFMPQIDPTKLPKAIEHATTDIEILALSN